MVGYDTNGAVETAPFVFSAWVDRLDMPARRSRLPPPQLAQSMRPSFVFCVAAVLAVTSTTAASRPLAAQAPRTARPTPADSVRARAAAKDTTDDDDDDAGSRVGYGVSGRNSSFQDGHAEYGGGMILTYAPFDWASLEVNPSYTVATNPKRTATTGKFNMSSVPVELDGSHEFRGALHPELGLSLGAEFPVATADTAATTHRPTFSAGLGLSVTPVSHLHLNGDVSRDLDGATARSILAASTATSASAGASIDAGDRLTLSAGVSGDLGTAAVGDTVTRSLGGSAAIHLAGPLTLTVDGSHRLQGNTPLWSVSVGIGTAFAGVATVGPASALSRMRHAAHALRGNGKGKPRTA